MGGWWVGRPLLPPLAQAGGLIFLGRLSFWGMAPKARWHSEALLDDWCSRGSDATPVAAGTCNQHPSVPLAGRPCMAVAPLALPGQASFFFFFKKPF